MQTKIQLQVSPATALNEQLLKEEVREMLFLTTEKNLILKILKRTFFF